MGNFSGGVSVNFTNRGVKGGKRTPYLRIKAGPLRGKYVHVLVAEAMLGRALDPIREQVDHLDGNGLNPAWTNLEVVTPAENKRRMNERRKEERRKKERKRVVERRVERERRAGQVYELGMEKVTRPDKRTSFNPAEWE